jgi:hypothetical protein
LVAFSRLAFPAPIRRKTLETAAERSSLFFLDFPVLKFRKKNPLIVCSYAKTRYVENI